MDVFCCHGRICFSTRTESELELWEDGFYFEVFPLIVHYCRELLLREAEVSNKGSRASSFFICREIKLTHIKKLHLCINISVITANRAKQIP